MKTLLRTFITVLLLTRPSFAASVSSSYTCLQGHEQEATAKLQSYATKALTNFFRNRNIEINTSTLQFNVSLTNQSNIDGTPFVGFTGNASGGAGLTGSATAGTLVAKDGTKFNVLFSSGSDNQDMGEYLIVSAEDGFDREGNPINMH